jgi:hypothetical protein
VEEMAAMRAKKLMKVVRVKRIMSLKDLTTATKKDVAKRCSVSYRK